MAEVVFNFLVPSLWEIKITVAAAIFTIAAYTFFSFGNGGIDGDPSLGDDSIGGGGGGLIDDKDKVNFLHV